MTSVKKIVLDVLKPHRPDALEFSKTIAAVGADYRVHLTVLAMDEATETTRLEVMGHAINFDDILSSINAMGGSLHSIDEVIVHNETDVD